MSVEKRLIDANAFALDLRTMKSCLLGAPGCGKDRAKVVEMVEKMLSAAPTIDLESLHPVAHWEECDYAYLNDAGEVSKIRKGGLCCSRCRNGFKKSHLQLLWTLKCCPECGALMVRSLEAEEKLKARAER